MSVTTMADVRPLLLDTLREAGGEQVNPNVVLDAATYLELSGEMIRTRICTFIGADGEELCLRPDMTIPLARMVANAEIAPGRFFFSGRVFRLPEPMSDEPLEFSHTGFECFGESSSPKADAEGLAVGLSALEKAGVDTCLIRLNDARLFRAFVASFDLPVAWNDGLVKAYTRERGPAGLIEQGEGVSIASPLARALATLSAEEAADAVEDMLNMSGIPVVGQRSPSDIAARLVARSEDAAAGELPQAAAAAILDYMNVAGEARACVDQIAAIAKRAGVDVSAALNLFTAELDAVAKAVDLKSHSLEFDAGLGRRFDYYDGLVFEVFSATASNVRALASGGRYDGLVSQLSAGAVDATGFGLAMRPDRIAAAVAQEG